MPERDTAVDMDDDFEARTATLRAWLDGETVDAHDVGVEMQDWMSFFGFHASPQHRAAAWHTRRFPAAQPYHVALKAMEELGELAEVLNGVLSGGRDSEATSRRGSVPDEAADVAVCLLVLLGRWFPGHDLLDRVEAKLARLNDPESGHRSALKAGADDA